MIRGLFGENTVPYTLKAGLVGTSQVHREIAERVAGAITESTRDPEGARVNQADLNADMAALADNQIRFQAEARLLHLVYQGLRTSINGNG